MNNNNNFEEKLSRLEELSQDIRKPDISLEDALKNFEEGITLAKGMESYLNQIENKIQILMNGEQLSKDASSSAELDLFDTSTTLNGTRNS